MFTDAFSHESERCFAAGTIAIRVHCVVKHIRLAPESHPERIRGRHVLRAGLPSGPMVSFYGSVRLSQLINSRSRSRKEFTYFRVSRGEMHSARWKHAVKRARSQRAEKSQSGVLEWSTSTYARPISSSVCASETAPSGNIARAAPLDGALVQRVSGMDTCVEAFDAARARHFNGSSSRPSPPFPGAYGCGTYTIPPWFVDAAAGITAPACPSG